MIIKALHFHIKNFLRLGICCTLVKHIFAVKEGIKRKISEHFQWKGFKAENDLSLFDILYGHIQLESFIYSKDFNFHFLQFCYGYNYT